MEPVVTKRLIIRRMAETDLLDFLAYQTHPEVLRYMPIEPLTQEKAIHFLRRQAVTEIGNEGGYIVFAIYHISDAKMIGEVGINLLPKAQSKGEIGWSLHPNYQGRGYAAEAAQILLTYGFAHRKLHRITSICDTRNTASFILMERLGMRREGHLKQSQFIKGIWQDEYIYALLLDEWLFQQSIYHTQTDEICFSYLNRSGRTFDKTNNITRKLTLFSCRWTYKIMQIFIPNANVNKITFLADNLTLD